MKKNARFEMNFADFTAAVVSHLTASALTAVSPLYRVNVKEGKVTAPEGIQTDFGKYMPESFGYDVFVAAQKIRFNAAVKSLDGMVKKATEAVETAEAEGVTEDALTALKTAKAEAEAKKATVESWLECFDAHNNSVQAQTAAAVKLNAIGALPESVVTAFNGVVEVLRNAHAFSAAEGFNEAEAKIAIHKKVNAALNAVWNTEEFTKHFTMKVNANFAGLLFRWVFDGYEASGMKRVMKESFHDTPEEVAFFTFGYMLNVVDRKAHPEEFSDYYDRDGFLKPLAEQKDNAAKNAAAAAMKQVKKDIEKKRKTTVAEQTAQSAKADKTAAAQAAKNAAKREQTAAAQTEAQTAAAQA